MSATRRIFAHPWVHSWVTLVSLGSSCKGGGRAARASDTQHVATATVGILHHSLDAGLSDPLFLWFSFMFTVIPWGGTVTPHLQVREGKPSEMKQLAWNHK